MSAGAEIREALAPRVAAKIQARTRGQGIPSIEAEQLAHEIIGLVLAELDLARPVDKTGDSPAKVSDK